MDTELNQTPIELTATNLNNATYQLTSYSVTPGGVKIYGQDDSYKNYNKVRGNVLMRITAYDDLGNRYLMYPAYPNYEEDNSYAVYTIYDGPAD